MKIIWSFIWKDRKPLVKRQTCTLTREMGGINMVDIPTVIKVRRIYWIIRILQENNHDAKWHKLGEKFR